MSPGLIAANVGLRDAFLSALVAFGVFGAMIGLKTDPGPTSLVLTERPVQVGIAVLAVFFGRLAILSWRAARPVGSTTPVALAATLKRAGRVVAPLLLLAAVTLPFYAGRYYLDLGILVLTYVMLGWGLNIVVGLAGLLDLGYVAFYAVGAYSFGIFATTFDLGFWTCLPIAGRWRRFGASCSAFPCCGCAATTWQS